jgi:preprotein translocase subunit Sec61beta
MPEADPVEVAFAQVHDALIRASREPGLTPMAGGLLARALELSVQGVFVGWGFAVAPPKVQRYFDGFMAPHLHPAVAGFIRSVWENEESSYPDLDPRTVITACTAIADQLEVLAGSPPPDGWSPPPVPSSIGWAGLSLADQQLLARVRQSAQALCAEARVFLFGSRATGLARPGGDYDLLVIVPDHIAPDIRALIMGNVRKVVVEAGAVPDHHYVTLSTWQNPGPGSRTLVEQVKDYGIEVPGS